MFFFKCGVEDPRSELVSKKSFFDVVWMISYNLSITYNHITWKILRCNASCKQWWCDEGPLMPCLELTRIHCLKLHNVVLMLEVVQCCTIFWCYVIGARRCSLLEDIVAWKQITYEGAHEHVKFCCHWFAYKSVHLCVKYVGIDFFL
jgi:hypothetical protein